MHPSETPSNSESSYNRARRIEDVLAILIVFAVATPVLIFGLIERHKNRKMKTDYEQAKTTQVIEDNKSEHSEEFIRMMKQLKEDDKRSLDEMEKNLDKNEAEIAAWRARIKKALEKSGESGKELDPTLKKLFDQIERENQEDETRISERRARIIERRARHKVRFDEF